MANVDITRVAGNIAALNALNSLTNINNQLATHQARLATGKQLNSAADDPAGYAMGTAFNVHNNDLSTALSGIGDAKNLLATAEGGLDNIQDILTQMKSKAMEAQGDTIGTDEKLAIGKQLDAYSKEIDSIVNNTQWNGTTLLSSSGSSLNFLGGVTASGLGDITTLCYSNTGGFSTSGLGLSSLSFTGASASALGNSLSSAGNISSTVCAINAALTTVGGGITDVGAMTARLTFKENNLTTAQANTQAAYNRIMNANMASEQVEASKFTILQQTATAMLSQANSGPQFLLNLFK